MVSFGNTSAQSGDQRFEFEFPENQRITSRSKAGYFRGSFAVHWRVEVQFITRQFEGRLEISMMIVPV